TGAVARSEVPALLSAGDSFAFPTLGHEGLPLNVLEALSVGLPCVASDLVRPIFGPDLPISYVPPHEPRPLADALQRVTLHGAPERSLLPPRYSLHHCIDAYGSLLEQLVNRQPCSASSERSCWVASRARCSASRASCSAPHSSARAPSQRPTA